MRFVFPVILFIFWAACSNSEGVSSGNSSNIEIEGDSLVGMLRIKATGESILLGTNEVTAKANERPSMKVRFDYDFSMGRTEVTCAEFNDLMTARGLSLSCEASVPATNITYYDAVLFANERSKSEGFDTAYTYSRAIFDSEGHCSPRTPPRTSVPHRPGTYRLK